MGSCHFRQERLPVSHFSTLCARPRPHSLHASTLNVLPAASLSPLPLSCLLFQTCWRASPPPIIYLALIPKQVVLPPLNSCRFFFLKPLLWSLFYFNRKSMRWQSLLFAYRIAKKRKGWYFCEKIEHSPCDESVSRCTNFKSNLAICVKMHSVWASDSAAGELAHSHNHTHRQKCKGVLAALLIKQDGKELKCLLKTRLVK